MALNLPDFPWDSLEVFRRKAAEHPNGLIDLSVGSPVDPTPDVAVSALRSTGEAPGYPLSAGSAELREAIASWWRTVRHATSVTPQHTIATIGSKEFVALLPLMLGLGPSDTVVIPRIAYPTYAVGANIVGARVIAEDSPDAWPEDARLIWVNSPSNPTGSVLTRDQLREAIRQARARGAVLASDECYALLGPDHAPEAPSLLDDTVTEGDVRGLLALHSLSKQSNIAGYRAAFVAGDPGLIHQILQVRRHIGLLVPTPIQEAIPAILADTAQVERQRQTYAARRNAVREAASAAGWKIVHSEAGLYLWATRHTSTEQALAWWADRGALVAPGHFYGEAGDGFVRIALTATDAHIHELVQRLRAHP